MNFYAVTNGNYIEGYYKKRENALKAMRRNDELIAKFKDDPKVDKKGCWIEIIETVD